MEVFVAALTSLAINVPLYLVWLAGIAYAIMRRPRHPRVSLCVTVGLAALLLLSICTTIFNTMAPLLSYRNAWSTTQLGVMLAAVNGLAQLVHAAGWVLVLVAAFGWRGVPSAGRSET